MEEGAVVGAVFLAYEGNYISNLMSNLKVGSTGVSYVIDQEGTFISHTDYEKYVTAQINYIKSPIKGTEEVAQLQQNAINHFKTNSDVIFEQYKTQGANKFAVFTSIDGTDWTLVITTEVNEWLDETYMSIIVIACIAVALVIIAIVVCTMTANSIVNPIKKALTVMDAVSEGSLGVSIDYQSQDEIGQLAVAINGTISSLNGYVGEVSRICQNLFDGNFDVHREIEFKGDRHCGVSGKSGRYPDLRRRDFPRIRYYRAGILYSRACKHYRDLER